MHLWDIYIRIFHWLLAFSVIVAIIAIQLGETLLHFKVAHVIATLLWFRLIWGVIGTPYARFSEFVKGPFTILKYLKGQYHSLGHSPIGALSVITLLGALIVQILTGLVSEDGILFVGPLYDSVDGNTSAVLQEIHMILGKVIIGLIVLHILAIVLYLIRGKNLIKPMLNGGEITTTFTLKYLHTKAVLSLCVSMIITYLLFY